MKIGIFGGSFNPIHLGHVRVAENAIKELELDKLLVIPAAVSPFKTESNAAEFYDRLEMAKAIFAPLEKAEVDDRELKRGGVSYTIDTVKEIAAENPGAELYLIIGEDSLEGLPRWKDYEELMTLVKVNVHPRTPESSTEIRKLFEDAKVGMSPESKIVAAVKAGLIRKNGYCPCRLPKNPEFFCPCDEFKAQMADPSYHGLCHCRYYLKP